MRILGRFFKKEAVVKNPRGFYPVSVNSIERLTHNSVKITFDIPIELQEKFTFIPGQHINIVTTISGKEERRSYSICSGRNQKMAIAVKEVVDGTVSRWLNRDLCEGDELWISPPNGHFLLGESKKIVAIAAGSGITPIMSMAHEVEIFTDTSMKLFFVNKTEADIMFHRQLNEFSRIEKKYFLTQEHKDNFINKRLDQENLMALIKEDLSILKSDGFFICGPEGLIHTVKSTLELFGVPTTKIHFELFSVDKPDIAVKQKETRFKGTAKVTVIIDDEEYSFEMKSNQTVLEAASVADADPPYSCRGGVCCTCRGKVLKGSVKMDLNYTLTDKEIEQGYVLTCQSRPTSEEIIISYDE